MSKIEKIEQEIARLGRGELAALREWFRRYDAEEWDRQLEEDIQAGRLEALADQALASHKAGKSNPL